MCYTLQILRSAVTEKCLFAHFIVGLLLKVFYSGQKCVTYITSCYLYGAEWLNGRVLDSRPSGRGFEPHRRHCVVVLEVDNLS